MIGQLFKPWVSATVGLDWNPGKFTSDGELVGLWVVEGRTFASQDAVGNNWYSLSLGILLSRFKQYCVFSGEIEDE